MTKNGSVALMFMFALIGNVLAQEIQVLPPTIENFPTLDYHCQRGQRILAKRMEEIREERGKPLTSPLPSITPAEIKWVLETCDNAMLSNKISRDVLKNANRGKGAVVFSKIITLRDKQRCKMRTGTTQSAEGCEGIAPDIQNLKLRHELCKELGEPIPSCEHLIPLPLETSSGK